MDFCGMQDLISLPGIKFMPLAAEEQISNHWTVREFLIIFSINKIQEKSI